MNDPLLNRIVPRLSQVAGVAGVALGGSRARGTATEASDTDIGLYFHEAGPPHVEHLRRIAAELSDAASPMTVTAVGAWGPRIVGGAWLSIAGRKVDLLYRPLEGVEAAIEACRAGRVEMAYQPGHPHGFSSATWAGEIALCVPLYDPIGWIAALKAQASPYPDALRDALVAKFLFEVGFSIDNAALAIAHGDTTHVAGCAYRALGCVGQVLFAINGRYLINEKGALAEATSFSRTIPELPKRVAGIWAAIGAQSFSAALADLRALDADLRSLAPADT
jgi:predicted nucleotidyltransferase